MTQMQVEVVFENGVRPEVGSEQTRCGGLQGGGQGQVRWGAKGGGGNSDAIEQSVWYLGTVDADWTTREDFAMELLEMEDEDLQEVEGWLLGGRERDRMEVLQTLTLLQLWSFVLNACSVGETKQHSE